MFNSNDNKNDDLFKDEKNGKSLEEIFDFKGFSHKQEEVVLDESKDPKPVPKSQISFHDFDESPIQEETKTKKRKTSLKEHFKKNRATQKQIKTDKVVKKSVKKQKKVGRKKRKEIEEFEDIKKRRVYKYKRKKYSKVEDFIKYLNEHYLDIDEIADKILNDENFHGWLKKRSKRFDESINEFRDIVEIIGN